MNKPCVYIRVDGSHKIGLGHIYRCLALAKMIDENHHITFWSHSMPINIRSVIKNHHGYDLNIISCEQEFFGAIDNFSGNPIIVCDGYNFDAEYQKRLKKDGLKIVCIDDMCGSHFFADVVINHAPGISVNDYSTENYTELYLGPEFALLRPKFLELTNQHKVIEQLKTVFICIGGSDPKNFTSKFIRALEGFENIKEAIVVTGVGFKYKRSIEKVNSHGGIKVTHYHDANDDLLFSSMQNADFAIVPSSTILFETLAARLPVLTGYFIDNQKRIYRGFLETGAVIGIGELSEENVRRELSNISLEKCLHIVSKQKDVIDRRSPERVKNIFEGLLK